ncbi:MAG: hypothetical protein LAT82_04040 [Nanoarchaeota archaeon]|nr:hypothetical protein [Nanoarchaeota archaeon]
MINNTAVKMFDDSSQYPSLRKAMGQESRVFMHYKPSDFREDGHFSQRALFLADKKNGDKIVGKFDLDYLNYLRDVGVEIPNDKDIISIRPTQSIRRQLSQTPILGLQDLKLSFYDETDPSKIISTQGLSTHGVLRKGSQDALEDKINFRNFALNNHLPYVEGGKIFSKETGDDSDLEKMIKEVGDKSGVVIRATTGAGVNFVLPDIRNKEEFRVVIEDIMRGRGEQKESFLVEPRLELVSNPNRTAYITDNGQIIPISISEQLVDENLKFTGSIFDRTQTPDSTPYLDLIGNRLYEDGYRGVFGVDLMRDVNNNSYMVEANVRTNASNYTSEILNGMETLLGNPILRAYAETIDMQGTSIRDFSSLQQSLEGVLFNGVNPQGVMPISPSPLLKKGKVQLITYGNSVDDIEQIRNETSRRFQIN